jgi:cytochrome c oxidase subunit II
VTVHDGGSRANATVSARPELASPLHAEGIRAAPRVTAPTDISAVRRRARSVLPILCMLALGGCGSSQNSLQPHSRPASEIRWLWWGMLAAAAVVFFGAVAMLALAWIRKRSPGLPLLGQRKGAVDLLVVLFGIAIPVVVLVALFVVANLVVIRTTQAPAQGSTQMSIEVTGKQWFWVVAYDGTNAVTANEIHIPTRTRVRVNVHTADVIHSFWVPELNRKIDTTNGLRNSEVLYADRPGRYLGDCAELCGLQHAHMGLEVVAQPPAQFRAWLAGQARPAAGAGAQAQGRRVFVADQCASCHQIRGTSAAGQIGPDLTHVASRRTLAALTIPNTPRSLAAWLSDPQKIKPGNKMPDLGLSRADVHALVAYLESLK